MKIKTIILATFLIISNQQISQAKDLRYSIGVSNIYADIKNPDYKYDSKKDYISNSNLNFSILKEFQDKINIGFTTNRFFNSEQERTGVDAKNNKLNISTSVTYDTLSWAIRNENWMPGFFMSNVTLKQKFYDSNDKLLTNSKQNTIICGFSVSYFFNNKFAGNVSYLLPNDDIYMNRGISIGINYFF